MYTQTIEKNPQNKSSDKVIKEMKDIFQESKRKKEIKDKTRKKKTFFRRVTPSYAELLNLVSMRLNRLTFHFIMFQSEIASFLQRKRKCLCLILGFRRAFLQLLHIAD